MPIAKVMLHLVAALLLAALPAAAADLARDAEIKRVEAELARIQQAQTSLYQQFQMAQELRRAEEARPDPFAPQANVGIAPPPMDYEELKRRREAREQRIKDLGAQLDALYQRYQALETEKAALLERWRELTRAP